MKWFRNWVLNALDRAAKKRREEFGVSLSSASLADAVSPSRTGKSGHKRVEILNAANGKVLEIFHRAQPQHDWEVTLYIVRDDETLADAIAAALVITGESQ